MGTHAIWTFDDRITGRNVSVYTHWDGYPQGAAAMLYDFARSTRRGLAERFISTNDEAEIIGNGSEQPLDEYNYRVTRERIGNGTDYSVTAAHLTNRGTKPAQIFSGSLAEFIERYHDEPLIHLPNIDHRPDGREFLSPTEAQDDALRFMNRARTESRKSNGLNAQRAAEIARNLVCAYTDATKDRNGGASALWVALNRMESDTGIIE